MIMAAFVLVLTITFHGRIYETTLKHGYRTLDDCIADRARWDTQSKLKPGAVMYTACNELRDAD
jgi:hypothetical protein